MKNNKILIIATIVLLVGIALLVCAFALNGFKFGGLNSETYEEKNYSFDKPCDKIIIDDDNGEISFKISEDDKYAVNCYDSENLKYEVSDENGILLIKKIDNRKWWQHIFNFSFGIKDLEVMVPASFAGDIEIETNNGGITFENIKAENIKLNTDNGKITLSDTSSSNGIDIENDNGNISLTNTSCTGKLKIDTENSKITLTSINAGNLEIDKSNGGVKLLNVSVVSEDEKLGNVKIEGNNDSVDFDTLSFSGNLTIETDNGHIKGTIKGRQYDYSFRCDTDNGSCNLPEKFDGPYGSKLISLKTDNGAIDVEFTEK